ncbi:hypothetical protein WJX84_012349 [Apatococcus fuscideae]|uniref:PAS domain-containing protein n=1 Tax=Apatococcus fuscideae TaxID=2026836 RepID=A0AAW1RTP4_9CHLO
MSDVSDLAALPEVQALERVHLPCWLHRIAPGSLAPSLIWCNAAAHTKFGRPWTEQEHAELLASMPEAATTLSRRSTDRLYKAIIERKESFSYWVDPARALGQTFSAIQTDATAGDLHFGPFPVTLDGVVETPIHSYLFDSSGKLLYANLQAKRSFKAKGTSDLDNVQLEDLLLENGTKQPDIAAQALKALLVDKSPAHRITLRSMRPDGRYSWRLFEMWPRMDQVLLETAILVNSFNVTSQKELAEQLDAARKELLKRNTSLERSCYRLKESQEKLELLLL